MVNKLINSRLSAVMPTDPSVALHTWLKSVWGTSTGFAVPDKGKVKFDIKFGAMKGFYNYVIIESMPTNSKPQTIGGSRHAVEEKKRIQIMCVGPNAQDTKWNMEKHIESLINGNVTGMRTTYGISEIMINEFAPIGGESESQKTDLTPNTAFQKSRSFASVSMRYELESTSA